MNGGQSSFGQPTASTDPMAAMRTPQPPGASGTVQAQAQPYTPTTTGVDPLGAVRPPQQINPQQLMASMGNNPSLLAWLRGMQ